MGKQFDGITVDGKSIESYLLDESDKEVGEVIQQERTIHRKKGSKVRYMETKEKNGKVKTTPQSELNKINIKANIQKSRTRAEKVLAHLLAGHKLKAKQVAEAMQIRASDAASMLRGLYKSNLGKYMIRDGNPSKGYEFSMDIVGLELIPEQAYEIYKSKEKIKSEEIEPGPIEYKVPEPPELVRAPLDINLNISGGIQITFAFKLER